MKGDTVMSKSSSRRSSRSKKSKYSKRSKTNWQWIVGGIALAAIIVVGGILLFTDGDPTTTVPLQITVDEAYQKYQDGAFLLDVRTPEEWIEYHAPNTTLIPLDELEKRVDEVPKDQEIVVVCRSGNRSQVGRDILRAAGHSMVTSMGGGLNSWRDAGYPIVSGP